jgi:hypothetical protein
VGRERNAARTIAEQFGSQINWRTYHEVTVIPSLVFIPLKCLWRPYETNLYGWKPGWFVHDNLGIKLREAEIDDALLCG